MRMRNAWVAGLLAAALAGCGGGSSNDGGATYSITGKVTGRWVEGVTVTAKVGATTVATDVTAADGTYSFAGLDDAKTYTVTPSLAGYDYTPAQSSVAVSGADEAGVDFAAASVSTSRTVSGTVIYTATPQVTGQVYVTVTDGCPECFVAGTSFPTSRPKPWTYTVSGAMGGSVEVRAYIDTIGAGMRNGSSPAGTSAGSFDVNAGDVTGADVTLTNPTLPTFQKPGVVVPTPGDGAVFVLWQPQMANGDLEEVSGYRVYRGTDAVASNGGYVDVPARNSPTWIHYGTGVTNGSTWYYKVAPYFVDAAGTKTVGDASVTSDVASATVGPTAGGNTVTVRADYTGLTATGPLFAVLIQETPQSFPTFRFAKAATNASGTSVQVAGVPAGEWKAIAFLDQNSNGVPGDAGDVGSAEDPVTVPTSATQVRTLATVAPSPYVTTHYYSDGTNHDYRVSARLESGMGKLPVKATVWSGKKLPLPLDLPATPWGSFESWVSDGSQAAPLVGDVYKFRVTYSDGTVEDFSHTLDIVYGSANLPRNPGVVTTGTVGGITLSNVVPQFTWQAPTTPPAKPTYLFELYEAAGAGVWRANDLTATSFVYDAPTPLVAGTPYVWNIQVRDPDGNSAMLSGIPYTP